MTNPWPRVQRTKLPADETELALGEVQVQIANLELLLGSRSDARYRASGGPVHRPADGCRVECNHAFLFVQGGDFGDLGSTKVLGDTPHRDDGLKDIDERLWKCAEGKSHLREDTQLGGGAISD
jgi:hypothetical protein